MSEVQRTYPQNVDCNGVDVRLDMMSAGDEQDVLAFARSLPEKDLLFMRRDIRQAKVVAAWSELIEQGRLASLLAWSGDKVVGCTALIVDPLSWSPHVGELRVIVSRDMRGLGLGRVMIQEGFAMALSKGLEKLVAQMTIDQQSAIAVFEGLGFRGEALMRNHVKDADGGKHDIVLLSHDVARVQSQMEAYGLTDAF
ncbi:GNAT family N-acetyltransferase [Afipia sp. GAS231]|uniref:GNAT family N-acetyltransferase n=1 Tax=Afipia sp. GAS231 TaxID=1882747 RepID=UPI00087DBC68|nr:GNAT family N-acetyltransferase [Afipia sp. GAS231]SDO68641.1 Protein N-acetyltransferase, RimJ/RimL family [Afipia sp. GAS231]